MRKVLVAALCAAGISMGAGQSLAAIVVDYDNYLAGDFSQGASGPSTDMDGLNDTALYSDVPLILSGALVGIEMYGSGEAGQQMTLDGYFRSFTATGVLESDGHTVLFDFTAQPVTRSDFRYFKLTGGSWTNWTSFAATGETTKVAAGWGYQNGAAPIIYGSGPSLNFRALVETSFVPEPTTWIMMAMGFLGLGALIRRAERIGPSGLRLRIGA